MRLRVGPLVWNVMYDSFLRADLSAGRSYSGLKPVPEEIGAVQKFFEAKTPRSIKQRDITGD